MKMSQQYLECWKCGKRRNQVFRGCLIRRVTGEAPFVIQKSPIFTHTYFPQKKAHLAVWWRNEHPDGQSPQLWEVAEKRGNSQDLELDSAHYSHSKPKYTECFLVWYWSSSTAPNSRNDSTQQIKFFLQSKLRVRDTWKVLCTKSVVWLGKPPPHQKRWCFKKHFQISLHLPSHSPTALKFSKRSSFLEGEASLRMMNRWLKKPLLAPYGPGPRQDRLNHR